MEYVEFLRVRKAFVIFAVGYAVLMAIVVGTIFAGIHSANHAQIVIDGDGAHGGTHGESFATATAHLRIPFGVLFGIAAYGAIVFATVLATSLNKERDGLAYVFVKPISREALALRYVAIDAAGIVLTFAYTLVVVELVPLALLGFLGRTYFDASALWVAALGLGVGFMWYGLLQAATVRYAGKGGTLVGLSWAAFFVLAAAASVRFFGPIFHDVVYALDLVNPIAYFSSVVFDTSAMTTTARSVVHLPLEIRATVVWIVAGLAISYAVLAWKRVEV